MFWSMWVKRILGFLITGAAATVSQKYGTEWGTAVGLGGGAILHQVDRFIIKVPPKPPIPPATDEPVTEVLPNK